MRLKDWARTGRRSSDRARRDSRQGCRTKPVGITAILRRDITRPSNHRLWCSTQPRCSANLQSLGRGDRAEKRADTQSQMTRRVLRILGTRLLVRGTPKLNVDGARGAPALKSHRRRDYRFRSDETHDKTANTATDGINGARIRMLLQYNE